MISTVAKFSQMYGGRTNQVWKVLGGDGDKVLKLYQSGFPNPLFRNEAPLEAACLRALSHTGFVPRLAATGRYGADRWVMYEHAPGAPWQSGVETVAALLHKLHGLRLSLSAPMGCNGSVDLARHTEQILAGCSRQGRQALAPLRPVAQVAPTPDTCLIHGDPVAGNILVAGSGITLIDWQCPAIGDPCEDIAMFLSPAMQRLYRGAPLDPGDEARFLQAYANPAIAQRYRALRPWFAWRMAAYCLWRVETGAPDYAQAYELERAAIRDT